MIITMISVFAIICTVYGIAWVLEKRIKEDSELRKISKGYAR